MSADGRPIIIVKKKKAAHGGHHGGSWKVAYADFVTAMMAFFMVMWILGMDQGVKDMVEGYFSNPVGFKRAFSGGSNPMTRGSSPSDLDPRRARLVSREQQRVRFEQAAEEIGEKMEKAGLVSGQAASVEVVVTEQGLRIELMETGEGEVFFDKASASLKSSIRSVLDLIAPELEALPNEIVVEGHTDALPFGSSAYSNWELSVDRANAARRVLLEAGLSGERIMEVRGYADRELKNPENPLDPRNRRISVLLPYREELQIEFYKGKFNSGLGLSSDRRPLPDGVKP